MGDRPPGQRKGGDEGGDAQEEPAPIEEDTSGIYEIMGKPHTPSRLRLIDPNFTFPSL